MSVTVASDSPTSRRRSRTRRWPTSRSAAVTPWWVYSDSPVTSMVTSVCGASSSSSSYGSSRSSSSSSSRSGAIAAQRSSRDREGIRRGRDVVDAEDARAALEGEDVGGDRRRDAVVRVLAAGEAAEEGLARGADEHRETDRDDLVQAAQQCEVVLDGLAEADARVEHDPLLGDALREGEGGALLEERLEPGVGVRVDVAGDEAGDEVLLWGADGVRGAVELARLGGGEAHEERGGVGVCGGT